MSQTLPPAPTTGPSAARADERSPLADPRAVVRAGNARFTVLTPAMIRMEYAPDAQFEDRASQAFINRRLPVPEFTEERDGEWVVVRTAELTLRYAPTGGAFDRSNLSVAFRLDGRERSWRRGDANAGNLGGTIRTLDGVSGACPIEPGLLSRDGWVVVDDSAKPLFDGDPEWDWMAPRTPAPAGDERIDWYFMGYGRDYARALRDYTLVAGAIPMVPRYVLGSWWSRYWPYSDEDFKNIVAEFDEHGVPIDVLVLDMDWHLDGWTGYTWNPEHFPDPAGFLAWCEANGLRTTLNLHPADGVGKHEAAFNEMKAAVGAPKHVYRIPFDCTDKRFVRAYFDVLHRPMEKMGVDFWWMDWQQGTETSIEGLDPLWWLNHLHWRDMATNPERGGLRPLIFSRWGGLGNHRYQIGFSGDTFNDWASLAFQPHFTATASNVGYCYWSHDIGGHQPGPVEDELYARWVQYGVYSPVLRTHSGRDPRAERKIWTFRPDCFEAMRRAFVLRYALAPYIYTAMRRAHDEAVQLCRPLYHEWPDLDEAYGRPGQYLFGDALMVAPVTRPMSEGSGAAGQAVWIPPGEWVATHSGAVLEGPREVLVRCDLDEVPVFARRGAIVTKAPPMRRTGEKPLDPLVLEIWGGERGAARLYEDDGLTDGYTAGAFAWTPIEHDLEGETRVVRVGPTEGTYDGAPESRSLEIRLRDEWPARRATVGGEEVPFEYDASTLTVVVRTPAAPVGEPVEVRIELAKASAGVVPTRTGLRGRLALLDDVAATLGAHTPRIVEDLRSIRGRIEGDPDAALREGRAMLGALGDLVEAVATSAAPAPDRERALARLLGLSCELSVETDELGAVRVVASGAAWSRFERPADLKIGVDLRVEGDWAIGERRAETRPHETAVETAHASAVVDPGETPAMGAVVAEVVAEVGGRRVALSERRVCFPSINAWAIVGPFRCPFDEQPGREFGPALDAPGGPFTLDESYGVTDDGPLVWRRTVREADTTSDPGAEFRVDLHEVFGVGADHAVAYGACELHADREREVVLAIGSDDGFSVWLNGEALAARHVQRGYRPREDRVTLPLKAGRNTLLVKIEQALGGWAFGAHVEEADGSPASGVRVTLPGG